MMMDRRCVVAAAILGMASALAVADTIQLKNGQSYSGTVSREGDLMVIHTDDGKTISAKPGDIAAVMLNDTVSTADAASAEWTRIAQKIAHADDLQTIIRLHKEFLEKYPDVAKAGEVKSSLDVYQKLAENDGVKFRGRWVPRAQIDVIVRQWKESAKPATDLYQQGHYKDALEPAKSSLADDGHNPEALTVAGLAAFHLKDAPAAKTYFTMLATADPTALLAENNLAVIASVQKQPAEGLIHYSRALSINPENRLLLDNIAEAIAAYLAGGGSRDVAPYRVLASQVGPAEKKMEARMARADNGGLVRWGATWITPAQLNKFNAYIDHTASQKQQLQAQVDKARQVLAGIENQLKEADADIENAMQALNFFNAELANLPPGQRANGIAIAAQQDAALQNRVLAQAYRDAVQKQYDACVAETQDYFAEAARVGATLAAGPGQTTSGFSGSQQLMEMGDAENPPKPASVGDPPALPSLPVLPRTVSTARPLQRPTYTLLVAPALRVH